MRGLTVVRMEGLAYMSNPGRRAFRIGLTQSGDGSLALPSVLS
jgi:hypothetical protein